MADLSFDDLIPAQGAGAGTRELSFDDLVPAAPVAAAPAVVTPDALAPLREATAAHDAGTTWYERIWNDLRTGMSNARQGYQATGLDTAARFAGLRDQVLTPPSDQAPIMGGLARAMREQDLAAQAETGTNIADALASASQGIVAEQQLRETIPQRPVMEAMDRAGTFGEAWDVFKTDPLGAAAGVTFQSVPQQIPSIVASTLAGVTGGAPIAMLTTVLTQGMSSFGAEYGSALVEGLAEAGVNMNDPAALATAFQDPTFMASIRDRATTRGAIIGGADALSGGLASRTLVPGQMVRGVARREALDKAVAQPVQGAVLGAGGEAAAQLATDGEISKPGAVFMEALGEGAMAPVEGVPAAVGAMRDRAAAPVAPPAPSVSFDDLVPPAAPAPAAPPPAPPAPAAAVPVEAPAAPAAPTPAAPPPEAAAAPAAAPVAPAEPPAPAPAPAAQPEAVTATGRRVPVGFEVVDLSTLQAATGDLQPRDRTRATSDVQIAEIAANLDPQRLIQGTEADRGAPIVGPDNIVESGNGRIAALRLAAQQNPDRYGAYVQALQAAGYKTDGIKQPVLVRRRKGELTPNERRAFVYEANQSATMELSATERAKADAEALTPEMLRSFDPEGALDSARNRPFIQGWLAKLAPPELNRVSGPDGGLSQDGVRRLQGAMLARAYGDTNTVSRAVEATDDNARSVTGGLTDASAAWARLRGLLETNQVDRTFDVTPQLMRAVDMLRTMREQGRTPQQVVGQQDMLNALDPVTESLFRSFFNKNSAGELTTAASRTKIADVLRKYVDEAAKQKPGGDMFGGTTTPEQILKTITTPKQETLFGEPSAPKAAPTPAPTPASAPTAAPAAAAQPEPKAAPAPKPAAKKRASKKRAQGAAAAEEKMLDELEPVQDNAIPLGGLSRTVMQVSFTPRTSIHQSAFRAAGLDPAKAVLMAESEQIAVLRRLMKDTFGFRDVIVDAKADKLETVDQLLDAYQNVQHMLHVLGLPHKALGLNGTLTLRLERMKNKGSYLGAYAPGLRTIYMPGRTNSFAHEWMHALDHFIMDEFAKLSPQKQTQLFASYQASADGLDPTRSVQAAFAGLMSKLYFDNAAIQTERVRLTIEAAELNKQGKPSGKAKQAQKQLAAMDAGKAAAFKRVQESNYAAAAKAFGDPAYWGNPTEMLARVFEAFIASKMTGDGVRSEFVSKGDAAYLDTADRRLAETFPKGADRAAIFSALDNLFTWLRTDQVFGGDPLVTKPDPKRDVFTPGNVYEGAPVPASWVRDAVQRELNANRGFLSRWTDNLGIEEKVRDTKRYPLHTRIADHARGAVYSMRGVLNVATARNPKAAQPFLRYLKDRLVTDPGTGRMQTETFEEAVEAVSKKRTAYVAQAAARHGFGDGLTPDQRDRLRDLLTDKDEGRAANQNDPLVKLAADLRRLMKDVLYYVRTLDGQVPSGRGLPVGFVENYLPRRTNDADVFDNPLGFELQARKVYALVFDREFPASTFAAKAISETLAEMRQSAKNAFRNLYGTELNQIKKLVRKIAALEKSLSTSKDPDQVEIEIERLTDELQDALDEIRDPLKEAYANDHANAWRERILTGDAMDFGGRSPDASFAKKRELPPETDQIMKGFMVTDPLELVTSYVQDTTARVEYAKRFGTPGGVTDIREFAARMINRKGSGWNPGVHNPNTAAGVQRIINDFLGPDKADYTEIMLLEAVRNGAMPEDVREFRESVQIIAGRNRDSTPSKIRAILGWINTLGMISLLPRAIFSSFAEPVTMIARTRDGRAAWETFGAYMGEAIRTSSAKDRQAIAMAIGIIASPYHDQTINNRMGTVYPDSPALTKITSGFYRRVGQVALTNAQRRSAMQGAHFFIKHLAQRVLDPSSTPSELAMAQADLRELGIPDAQQQDFATWAVQQNGLPSVERIVDKAAPDANALTLYGAALRRIVDQTIQNPKKGDRPKFAVSSPVGRMMFGIMSFSYSFSRNVLLRQLIVTKRDAELRQGAGDSATAAWAKSVGTSAAWFAGFYAALFTGQLLSTIVREAIFNGERWEEKEKKGELWEWLLALAFSRTGVFGAFDPIVQAMTGLKYERDLTGLAVGPYAGYFLNALQAILQPFAGRNSEGTNTAEWNSAKGLYQLLMVPAISFAMSTLPAGPLTAPVLGVANMVLTSNRAADEAATAVVGEKDSRAAARERAGGGGF